jgi:hypothetical protein
MVDKLWKVWARRLRDNGATLQEIADTFGKSVSTVHYAIYPASYKKKQDAMRHRYYRNKLLSDPHLAGRQWIEWISESP